MRALCRTCLAVQQRSGLGYGLDLQDEREEVFESWLVSDQFTVFCHKFGVFHILNVISLAIE